ncbi:nuclear pore complex protein Nup98-Nup96-like isoform X3 [Ciona intestinalis]
MRVLLERGNLHLAMLVGQSNASVSSRVAVAKQLIEWEDSKVDCHLSDVIIKLYSMLAAKPVWLSSRGKMNCCEGLDWKRSLLVHLNYISDPLSPLDDAVELYKTSWKGSSEHSVYSVAPIPHYMDGRNDEVRDVLYYLLLLYCKRWVDIFVPIICYYCIVRGGLIYLFLSSVIIVL